MTDKPKTAEEWFKEILDLDFEQLSVARENVMMKNISHLVNKVVEAVAQRDELAEFTIDTYGCLTQYEPTIELCGDDDCLGCKARTYLSERKKLDATQEG